MKIIFAFAVAFALSLVAPRAAETNAAQIELRDFLPVKPMCRAQQAVPLSALVLNTGDGTAEITAQLSLPAGVRVLRTNAGAPVHLARGDSEATLTWDVESSTAQTGELRLDIFSEGKTVAQQSLRLQFLPTVTPRKLAYIPEPEPVITSLLIGAHNCPLWESDQPNMWLQLLKHPERTPALGFYAQENPEVADWETKWAVEHGVSFFIYCWYRASQGGPVQMHHEKW